jgi:hypothetical protein
MGLISRWLKNGQSIPEFATFWLFHVLLAGGLLLQSGCLSHQLKDAGEYNVDLVPVIYDVNNKGHIILECDLWRTVVRTGKKENLGKRYICASSKLWYGAAEKYLHYHCSENCKEPCEVNEIYYNAIISTKRVDEEGLFRERFCLYPPDLRNSLNIPPPGGADLWEPMAYEGKVPY